MDDWTLLTPSGARIGAMQRLYYEMAERAFVRCSQLKEEGATAAPAEEWSDADFERDNNILISAIECIVFAGTCLEAAIYDFAAWHLPKHVVDGVDKMDLVAKWRTIPYLICKNEIRSGGLAHNALVKLVGMRNRLVHAKSRWMQHGEALNAQFDRARRNEASIRVGHTDAMSAVIYLSLEIERLSPNTINPLPHFDPESRPERYVVAPDLPNPVAQLVSSCKSQLWNPR